MNARDQNLFLFPRNKQRDTGGRGYQQYAAGYVRPDGLLFFSGITGSSRVSAGASVGASVVASVTVSVGSSVFGSSVVSGSSSVSIYGFIVSYSNSEARIWAAGAGSA